MAQRLHRHGPEVPAQEAEAEHRQHLQRREGDEALMAGRRHQEMHAYLVQGLEAMGLSMAVAPECRLPMLNAVNCPEGVNEAAVRATLLAQGIEIGAGLGPLAGKIWRIGLMGHTARKENIDILLAALKKAI